MNGILNKEEINKIIEKLKIHTNEENININEIKKELINIGYFYNTNNKKKIDNLVLETNNKLDIIIKNHINYITVLNKNVTKYSETAQHVKHIFEGMDNNGR